MSNNDVLKKLRVALKLREEEFLEILKLVDFKISRGELSAFFRREDHPNYRECGDQILRNFLNGLVLYLRGTKEHPKIPGEVLLQKTIETQQKNPRKPFKNTDIDHVKYKNKKKS